MNKSITTKFFIAIGTFLTASRSVFAQNSFEDAISRPIEGFRDAIIELAPAAFVAILVVSALFNIGKVWGQDRDWKGFFIGLGLYVLAISAVVGVVAFIGTLRFG